MVKLHSIPNLRNDANVISSHVIYKVKVNDDNSLKLKAWFAAHENENHAKDLLRSDCSMCSPTGFRVFTSMESLMKWRLNKINVKAAFHQSGHAERNVFVIPTC